MKIGDFFEAQGMRIDKKTGRIKKDVSQNERDRELAEMGYSPDGKILDQDKLDYDPITGKSQNDGAEAESYYPNYELEEASFEYSDDFDDEEVEKANQLFLDNIENQNSLSEFIKTYEDFQAEDKESFENKNIILETAEDLKREGQKTEKIINSLPDYSDFEIKMFTDALHQKLEKMPAKFADGQQMTHEQADKLIDELKSNLPEKFTKIINRRLISEKFNWEKENFKDKNLLVSYFPDKKKAKIKYIMDDVEGLNAQKVTRVFVNSSLKGDKTVIKDANGRLLVFCSPPLRYKNDKKRKTAKANNPSIKK